MTELIAARAFAGIGGGGMQTYVYTPYLRLPYSDGFRRIVSIIMSDVVPLRQRGTWQGQHSTLPDRVPSDTHIDPQIL